MRHFVAKQVYEDTFRCTFLCLFVGTIEDVEGQCRSPVAYSTLWLGIIGVDTIRYGIACDMADEEPRERPQLGTEMWQDIVLEEADAVLHITYLREILVFECRPLCVGRHDIGHVEELVGIEGVALGVGAYGLMAEGIVEEEVGARLPIKLVAHGRHRVGGAVGG